MVEIKNQLEIESMRAVGALAAAQLEMIEPFVVPGVSTGELDRICHRFTLDVQNAIPAPLNYRGFPSRFARPSTMLFVTGFPVTTKF